MVLATVNSVNGVPIRLTKERWNHITTSHLEISKEDLKSVLQAVSSPDAVLEGDTDELLAIKKFGKRTWFVVAYKELDNKDGFVLTAYLTTDSSWLMQKEIVWNKK